MEKNDAIKIGIIGPYLSSSGTVTHVRTLVHGFHQISNVDPILITYIEPNAVVNKLKGPKLHTNRRNRYVSEIEILLPSSMPEKSIEKEVPIPTYLFEDSINPSSFDQFSDYLKYISIQENITVLMPQIKPFTLFCSVMATKKIIKEGYQPPYLIGVWHSNFGWIKDATYHLTMARMARPYVDAIIPVSENVKNDLKKYLGVKNNELLEIIPPGGINVANIQKDREALTVTLKKRFNINNQYIAFLGRHLFNKGIDTLLKAFKIVKESKQDISLVIMGSGPFTNHYKKMKDELNLKDVIFTGYLSDDEVYALLQGASLFCLPSRWESFSISVLEAMAAGRPVICTNVGGIPYWVGDSVILVSPDNPSELAKSIITILSNNSLAKELSKKSLQKAKEYDWMRLARKTIEEVQKVIVRHSNVCWDDKTYEFGDYHFDPRKGIITTPTSQMLIQDDALFFPSEALEAGNYFIHLETDSS